MAPLPQLGLSMSITDNAGSSFYAGNGQREKMTEFDSALKDHTISITISDEIVSEVELSIENNGKSFAFSLPTYKMMVTDDKTNETTFYETTRDSLLLDKVFSKNVGGFSLFGIDFFKKKIIALPSIAYEPLSSKIETYKVSKYRTRREGFLAYNLTDGNNAAMLIAGEIKKNIFQRPEVDSFFYVVDHNEGQKFIGDISYREKFIKSIPKVEIHLIKRDKKIKEIEFDTKGLVNKIIYL